MEPVEVVQKSGTRRKAPEQKRKFFGADFKLQIVRKYLEESVPVSVICQECGVSSQSVGRWVRAYRSEGEAGLLKNHNGKGRSLPTPVKEKIVEIKEANPPFGIKRISQLLKRAFFLSASDVGDIGKCPKKDNLLFPSELLFR